MLQAAQRPPAHAVAGAARTSVVVAGATGALGSEVLVRLIGGQAYALVNVLAREAITPGLRGVALQVVPGVAPAPWEPEDLDHVLTTGR